MKQTLFILTSIAIYAAAFSQTDTTNLSNTNTTLIKRQPRFFVSVHAGYAIGLGSTFKFYPDDVTSIVVRENNNQQPTENTTYKSTSKGLGDGFRYGAGLSYIINDFINVGFEFDYFKSKISRTRDSSYQDINENVSHTFNENYTISYDATLLTLSPTITFKAISRPKFYIYNKVGAVITYRPNSIQKNIAQQSMHTDSLNRNTDSSAVSYTRYEWGIKKPAFGFMGAIGTQFKLNERLRAFAEIQFSHIVFAVKNRVLTDYVVNGNNLTSTLSESEKVIVFKDDFSTTAQTSNPNQPSVTVVQRIPITYIGLQAGLAYRF